MNSPVKSARARSPTIAMASNVRQHEGGGVGFRPDAADQRGLAARLRHSPMQLGDKGAVAVILRRHQRDGLPGGRENRDAPAVGIFDIGTKAARLHRYRPVGQTDRRDIGVGPDPGTAGDLP